MFSVAEVSHVSAGNAHRPEKPGAPVSQVPELAARRAADMQAQSRNPAGRVQKNLRMLPELFDVFIQDSQRPQISAAWPFDLLCWIVRQSCYAIFPIVDPDRSIDKNNIIEVGDTVLDYAWRKILRTVKLSELQCLRICPFCKQE